MLYIYNYTIRWLWAYFKSISQPNTSQTRLLSFRSHLLFKMIKYLKPLQLFQESRMRGTVFLGLNFTDKFVSLSISDRFKSYATEFGAFPRDERILDNLVDKVQECVSDEYNTLEGIIIATKLYPVGPLVNIHTLMEDLCKKGKFESLKYTCWKDNTASRRTDVECNLDFDMLDDASRSLGGRGGGDLLDMLSAKRMLQTSLDVLNTLVERER
ncbi:hypothetical protein LWI29_027256 [Acer saccharum]|uniref:Uncharacterized protein n=1 Tax=Acer saccharum TaxID=4024 RepID=A0AA39W441_ACESA|nr:hypothetical protein LWI29_027256 [Acer saccharum]